MTIGKRKGYTAKGAGAQPNADNTKKVGGSLSKNDHWYIQEGFGMPFDPGSADVLGMEASGGIISEYTTPTGEIYRSHTFTASGAFTVAQLASTPLWNNVNYLVVGGGGGGAGWGPTLPGGAPGAGGAGALHYKEDHPVTTTAYPVVIGGGAPGSTGTFWGGWGGATPGNDTTAFGITADGGGSANYGHSGSGPYTGTEGGSGGGGTHAPPTGSGPGYLPVATGSSGHPGGIDIESPTDGWGNKGGTGTNNSNAAPGYGGGGGGGAATVGANRGPGAGGNGDTGAR